MATVFVAGAGYIGNAVAIALRLVNINWLVK